MAFDPDKFLMETTPVQQAAQNPTFDPDKFISETTLQVKPEPSFGQQVLSGVEAVGRTFDRFGGAPARAALSAGLEGNNPISAYTNQFGAPPERAPTGKEIAEKQFGVSGEQIGLGKFEDISLGDPYAPIPTEQELKEREGFKEVSVSPAGIVGLGIDVAVDPLAFIPIGKVAKGAGGLAGKGAKAILKTTAAAADFVTGTKVATKSGKVIGESLKDVVESISKNFKPNVALDFDELAQYAKQNNISVEKLPESFEFGKGSLIDKTAAARREIGGPKLEKYRESLREVVNATDNKIRNIGGGEILDDVAAGNHLIDSYNAGKTAIREAADVTHNRIISELPGLTLSPNAQKTLASDIRSIENFAKKRASLKSGPIKKSANDLLNAVEDLKASGNSYKNIQEVREIIGELAFKDLGKTELIAKDVQKLRDLYFKSGDVLKQTVADSVGNSIFGKNAVEALEQSNAALSNLFNNQKILKALESGKAPEKAFTSVIMNGDTKQIKALKEVVSEADFQRLKGAFLNNLTKRNQEGDILFRTSFNNLKRNAAKAGELLNEAERSDFVKMLNFGDRYGGEVLNKSGTEISRKLTDIVNTIRRTATNDALIQVMKDSARTRSQLASVERLAKAGSKEEALRLARKLDLPRRYKNAAIKRIKGFSESAFIPGPKKGALKASQVVSTQREAQRGDRK